MPMQSATFPLYNLSHVRALKPCHRKHHIRTTINSCPERGSITKGLIPLLRPSSWSFPMAFSYLSVFAPWMSFNLNAGLRLLGQKAARSEERRSFFRESLFKIRMGYFPIVRLR